MPTSTPIPPTPTPVPTVNDTPPVVADGSATIRVDAPAGSFVGLVTATDDFGITNYAILGSTPGINVDIDASTGELFVSGPLNVGTFFLTIEVTDTAGDTDTGTFTVTVVPDPNQPGIRQVTGWQSGLPEEIPPGRDRLLVIAVSGVTAGNENIVTPQEIRFGGQALAQAVQRTDNHLVGVYFLGPNGVDVADSFPFLPRAEIQWPNEPTHVEFAYAFFENVRSSGTVARTLAQGTLGPDRTIGFDPFLANDGELLVSVATTGRFGTYSPNGRLRTQIETGSSNSVLSVATLVGTGGFENIERTFTEPTVDGQSVVAVVFSPR